MKLHMFTADVDDGYAFHHTIDISFNTNKELLLACINIIGNLHSVFNTPVQLVTMENKTQTIDKKDVMGVMITAAEIPYSCFAEGPTLGTDGMYAYDPSVPAYARQIEVPEC